MGPPTVVSDRFELERLVGAGGMGSVYRAWDREEGRTVAVKLVKDAADHARFEREAAVLEALDHPGIVHYVAHGKTPDGGAFLAMEWVEGESVAALLDREQQLPADDAVLLCHRIARALAAAHAEGSSTVTSSPRTSCSRTARSIGRRSSTSGSRGARPRAARPT
ncbi:MAG: protein kinase [Polyangiaceae bacterium]